MVQKWRDRPQIANEQLHLAPAHFVVGRAQDRRGVNRRHHFLRQRRRQDLSALLRHPKGLAEDGLRGSRAQADEHLGPDQLELGHQPRPAGGDLSRIGLFVQTALSAAMSLIEPAILIVMGVVVAVVLLSLYMPIFSLGAGGLQ